MNKQRVVIALGGNALQQNGEVTAEAQKSVAEKIGKIVAKLANRYDIVISHGNGPQVGNILIHEESAATAAAPAMPLETVVAMSQGQIGYWLAQAIQNGFSQNKSRREVACVITQVVVDKKDPAFNHQTKPIGQFYSAKEAVKLSKLKGWIMQEDSGRGYRRVVPSPKPIDIVEKREIKTLVQSGAVVVAAGGGGIPVYRSKILHLLRGVDAVIDKDFAAAKLATLIDADIFVSVTAVSNAFINFGQKDQIALGMITPQELREHIKNQQFASGSMLPKVQAIVDFARRGKIGIITSPQNLELALSRRAGTIVQENL